MEAWKATLVGCQKSLFCLAVLGSLPELGGTGLRASQQPINSLEATGLMSSAPYNMRHNSRHKLPLQAAMAGDHHWLDEVRHGLHALANRPLMLCLGRLAYMKEDATAADGCKREMELTRSVGEQSLAEFLLQASVHALEERLGPVG